MNVITHRNPLFVPLQRFFAVVALFAFMMLPVSQAFATSIEVDGDADGIFDSVDNCPTTPNAGQEDADGNRIGDMCEIPATEEGTGEENPGDGIEGGESDTGDEVQEETQNTNEDPEGGDDNTQDEEVTVTNSCLSPSAEGDVEPFVIGTSGETSLQSILDTAGYSVSVTDDQMNYQVWNLASVDADVVTFQVKVLAKNAGNTETFGYYTAGDSGSFVSVFEIPPAVVGDTFSISVPRAIAESMAFAIKTSPKEPHTWHTENVLNDGGQDNVAVYNPSANTYILAFEDLKNDDNDHNDLVVEVSRVACVVEEEPEEELSCDIVSSDTTVRSGQEFTLSWSLNTSKGDMVTYSWYDGEETPQSPYVTSVDSDTTFAITVSRGEGEEVITESCSVEIDVISRSSRGGGSSRSKVIERPNLPEPEVLGASTDIMPVGAPNTGAGGTSPVVVTLPSIIAVCNARPSVQKST